MLKASCLEPEAEAVAKTGKAKAEELCRKAEAAEKSETAWTARERHREEVAVAGRTAMP